MNTPLEKQVDVIVVGAGFAGLYALHKLRAMGRTTQVIEAAGDVGGVWWWNRYPGARCDVESLQYSYSFDTALEQEWQWTERYAAQPEILAYIQHVADRHDLRRDVRFNTRVESARFDPARERWVVRTDAGAVFSGAHLIMASGSLSVPRLPDIPGIQDFKGKVFHTGSWPHEGVDLTGLRVGVVGTGSSGIQAIPQIARQAAQLTVFQRTANFSIPAWNAPLTPQQQQEFKAAYREHRARAREVGTLYEFSAKGALDVDARQREAEYQRRWDKGGVNFVHSFNDLMVNKASNDTISDFVRARIRGIVKDPAVAEDLCPYDHPLGTKRICVDTGYYETYNRPNVKLVNLRKTPIERFTSNAVRTSDAEYEIDVLVCATGYDALTGAVLGIDIQGRGGLTLREKWAHGPRTLLGLMTAGFPNLDIVTGAGSPSVLVNMVVGIEHHIDWITDCLTWLEQWGRTTIEPTVQAQDRWVDHVNAAANATLLPMANSWFLGANIPGKPRVFMPYAAKIGIYRTECQAVADKGYEGFITGGPRAAATKAATTAAAKEVSQ